MADIIDFKSRQRNKGNGPDDPSGPDEPGPMGLIPPNLPQDDYSFHVLNKATGEEVVYVRRGHLVITNTNIVLFNPRQEMIWGIPNDDSLVFFERIEPEIISQDEIADMFEDYEQD